VVPLARVMPAALAWVQLTGRGAAPRPVSIQSFAFRQ
jgi:hypothetical protein